MRMPRPTGLIQVNGLVALLSAVGLVDDSISSSSSDSSEGEEASVGEAESEGDSGGGPPAPRAPCVNGLVEPQRLPNGAPLLEEP